MRRALFDAAARVAGEFGYAEASIARSTEAAGVAQGTFYNYFASRQDFLDQLLPARG
ncbi:helix-turn-helix domain-containing protein [Roseomonas xinghualingensis]|uniref:helix-turn-helix domain-containing protein n=1 Tax=Roseomonas xinghualingensis TaxID=2986475 RepID=UPI0021F0EBBC|nr:helix-turn-helix domain-containing protein [Roseomonas sp. SXEYE001]MCV4209217.1 TetR/AcrR family transcriptional regulator [Roseomonas sp. SXEYE001]